MSTRSDPAAACRCFTAEDACRLALGAYYAASRDIEPPPGEPWDDGSGPWAGPAEFVEAFLHQVARRVYVETMRQGLDLQTGSCCPCPEAFQAAMREVNPELAASLFGPGNDSLPLPENRADNQLGSALEC